jgi:hypothetical protein
MIVWTTAREVAFEKICSTSSSAQGTGFDNGGIELGFLSSYGFTNGFTTGHTQNATGYTQSSSSSESQFGEHADVSSTYTSTTNFFPVGTITYSDVTLGYTIDNSQSGSFYTSGSYTFAKQTTTTETFEVYGSTTSSSTLESTQWTTVQTSSNSNVTEFVQTDAVGTYYFVEATSLTRTRTVVTESGTTKGNAHDTICMAEASEVLWVINENPEWSKPLTDNAVSTTQTTISDLRETVGLVAAVTSQSIESSASTFTSSFTSSSIGYITATVNDSPALINGSTTEQQISVSTSFEEPFWNSYTFLVNRQYGVFHYGNTTTVPVTWETINIATRTDVMASESWQEIYTIRSTTENTITINNSVGTFSIVGVGTTSSCYGNTEKTEVVFVSGNTAIASPPSMAVYSPAGVKLGGQVGLRFTGDGISKTDIEEGGTITLSYLHTVNDGELTRYTTASPVVPTWFTLSSDSFTYLTTTIEDDKTVDTRISGRFGIDGQTWQTIARARENGLIGGDLAEDETALIRINRGLYKNQSGGTSFFEGNDTTYVGTKDTTYWYPISYLQPLLAPNFIIVERNVSTWPSFSFMP